jgi:catechol 2,3-dioxygenase-like lactoylglutathione lyase family enzyme
MPGSDIPVSAAVVPMPPAPTADIVVTAVPVLRVAHAERSVRFYCGSLGFRQDWWHQPGPAEPATVSVSRGGASVLLTERTDVGRDGQLCVWTIELATLFVEWGGVEDVAFEHGPTAMPWGLTEIAFRDPDGNRIRVVQPTGCQT